MTRLLLSAALLLFVSNSQATTQILGPRFHHGETTLSADDREILSELAALLKRHENYKVILYANLGQTEPDDQKLSQIRLVATEQYLISLGINSTRILTKDAGHSWPLVPLAVSKDKTHVHECDEINIRIEPQFVVSVP